MEIVCFFHARSARSTSLPPRDVGMVPIAAFAMSSIRGQVSTVYT